MPEGHLEVSRTLVPGEAHGPAMVLDEPLSFWGGLDAETGLIIDKRHPQAGQCISGKILVMSSGRGSSSAASVLAEAIHRGMGPGALVMRESDEIIVLGAIVAELLYGVTTPVVLVSAATMADIAIGETIHLR